MFIKPQTVRGEAAVNLTGGWGSRDMTQVVGSGEEHTHRGFLPGQGPHCL